MRIVDVNLLLYAVNPGATQHRLANRWLNEALSGGAPVGFAWLVIIGFVRIATNPRVFARPITTAQAMDQVDQWLEARSASVVQPGHGHAAVLRRLLDHVGTGGNLVSDAHLAALAIEHKATVMTFDTDFGRFPGVRWETPR